LTDGGFVAAVEVLTTASTAAIVAAKRA